MSLPTSRPRLARIIYLEFICVCFPWYLQVLLIQPVLGSRRLLIPLPYINTVRAPAPRVRVLNVCCSTIVIIYILCLFFRTRVVHRARRLITTRLDDLKFLKKICSSRTCPRCAHKPGIMRYVSARVLFSFHVDKT